MIIVDFDVYVDSILCPHPFLFDLYLKIRCIIATRAHSLTWCLEYFVVHFTKCSRDCDGAAIIVVLIFGV